MKKSRASRFLAVAVAAGAWACCVMPAIAASSLAAMPVGVSVTYHITTTTIKPPAAGGQSSTDNYLRLVHTSPTTFTVTLDGAPAGQITLSPNGSPIVPPALKKAFAPFGEAALLMRSAPQPLAPNSSWAANLPIPLDGQTDNVTAVVSVARLGPAGATVVASGQNDASVKPLVRQKPADVNFSATLNFNAGKLLSNASSNVSVAIRDGRFRTTHVGSSWTLSLTGP